MVDSQRRNEGHAAKTHQLSSLFGRIVGYINSFQQRHQVLAFMYAVQKKYGDNNGGYRAALLTYYGFLSLLPLIVVGLLIAELPGVHRLGLQSHIDSVINRYFPVLGSQITQNVHAHQKAGVALVVAILITLYGAQGVASAFQYVMNSAWLVPRKDRIGGWKAMVRSLCILVVGGIGLAMTVMLSTFAAGLGRGLAARMAAVCVSMVCLFGIVLSIFKLGLSTRQSLKTLASGALAASIGLEIMQLLGGLLVTRELMKAGTLYGSFALVLGLLFWIYVQSEVVIYAVELNVVSSRKLWPRSLVTHELTPADKRAASLYALE